MIEARKILVRAPNWAGDVVMATPGLRALHQRFPEAHVTVHVRPGLEPLLTGAPWCHAVRPVRSYHRGAAALWSESRELAAEGFDLGVCLPDSFSSALLFRAAGIRPTVGYRRGGRRLLLDVALPRPRTDRAVTIRGPSGRRPRQRRDFVARELQVLGLMGALGARTDDTRLELHTSPEEVAEAETALAAAGVAPDAPLAVLAPGASYGSSKLWPAQAFARVGDGLSEAGARVVLTGSPGERGLCAGVAAQMRAKPADLSGELSLGSLKAVVRRARVLVCNDAGTRHVAVAFGVPSVVLLGPTSLEKTDQNLAGVAMLSADVDCRPCYLRECPIDHRCMTRIEPERVLAAALPSLRATPVGRSA